MYSAVGSDVALSNQGPGGAAHTYRSNKQHNCSQMLRKYPGATDSYLEAELQRRGRAVGRVCDEQRAFGGHRAEGVVARILALRVLKVLSLPLVGEGAHRVACGSGEGAAFELFKMWSVASAVLTRCSAMCSVACCVQQAQTANSRNGQRS